MYKTVIFAKIDFVTIKFNLLSNIKEMSMLALSSQNVTLSPRNLSEQSSQETFSEKFIHLEPVISEAKKAIAQCYLSEQSREFGSLDQLKRRLACFLANIGNFTEALETSPIIMKIGKEQLKLGNSLDAIEGAKQFNQEHDKLHYLLYIAYKRAKYGDTEGATMMLNQFFNKPIEKNLREYLVRLYATLGQFDEAKKVDLELPPHYPFPQYRANTYLVVARGRSGNLEGNEYNDLKQEIYSQLKIHLEIVILDDINNLQKFLSYPSETAHNKFQHYLISELSSKMLKIKENLTVYKKLPSLSGQIFVDLENALKYFMVDKINTKYFREPKREELIREQYYQAAQKEINDLGRQIFSQIKIDSNLSNGQLVDSETTLKYLANVQIKIQDFKGALETISCYPHISCLSNKYQSELFVKLGEAQFKAGKIKDAYNTVKLIKEEYERNKLVYIIENKQKITPYWNCTSYWWNHGNDRLNMPSYGLWHKKLADYASKDLSEICENKELARNIKIKNIALKNFAAARIQEKNMDYALAAIDCIDSPLGRASVLVELLEEQLIN